MKRSFSNQSFGSITRDAKRPRKAATVRFSSRTLAAAARKAVLNASEQKVASVLTTEAAYNVNAINPYSFLMPDDIIQGDNNSQRIGNKILCNKLEFERIYYNNGNSNEDVFVREFLIKVKGGKYQSTADIVAHLFDRGNADVGPHQTVLDIVDLLNFEDFTVLSDRVFKLSHVGGSNASQMHISKYSKTMNQTLLYSDSGQERPTNARYQLFAFVRSGANDGAVNTVEVTTRGSVYFKDM